jgi:hypothetical protein
LDWVSKYFKNKEDQIGGKMKKLLLIILVIMVIFSLVNSGDFKYVGVKKCRSCHKGERKGLVYEKWLERAHAHAFETLKKKGEEKNPKCLPCHTTGFDKGGYKIGDPDAAKFVGVQCESCHGPGSVYKKSKIMKNRELALKNGLVNITEETCTRCHDSAKGAPMDSVFDFKKALKAIDHTYRKK